MNLKSSARASWEIVASRRWFCFLPFTLCAVLGAPSFLAASESEPRELIGYRGVKSAPNPFHHARHGMLRFDVIVAVGMPDQKLSPDVWIYWDCKSNNPADSERGFDTMVLRFEKDRLIQMRLVEGRAIKAFIAAQAKAAASTVARR